MKNYHEQLKILTEKKSRILKNVEKERIKINNIENQISNIKIKMTSNSTVQENLDSTLEDIFSWNEK